MKCVITQTVGYKKVTYTFDDRNTAVDFLTLLSRGKMEHEEYGSNEYGCYMEVKEETDGEEADV